MMLPAGRHEPAQWAAVSRHRPLLVAAVLCLASGCASNHASGVEAIGSSRLDVTAIDERVVVTLPGAIDDATARTVPPRGSDEVVTVATLVEPTVDRPSTVAVIGDSLTHSAEDEIFETLTADGFDVLTVDGLESRRMTRGGSSLPPGTAAIEHIQAVADPGLWVIALGTNDVASTGSADEFRSEMREVLALLPSDVPVVWVDLWIRDRQPTVSAANALIRQELRAWRGGAAVVDWYSHGDDDGIITGDGVHLTNAGQQLFADSISGAIDELFDDS